MAEEKVPQIESLPIDGQHRVTKIRRQIADGKYPDQQKIEDLAKKACEKMERRLRKHRS